MAADIALTAAKVAPVYPQGECGTEIVPMVAAVAITQGQAVYSTTAGKADLADSGAADTGQFRGIALEGVGIGQVVNVLKQGFCYGFTISGLDYGAILYLSGTAGSMNDTTSGSNTICGRVANLTDASLTKVAWIQADWLRTWV